MKKVILSMPSSGSDWFADCWRAEETVFHKEFFNPITNPLPNVVEAFGCEMVSHYKHIAHPGNMLPAIDDFLASQWTMTKEVWIMDPRQFLEKGLEVSLFLRRAENTFPPSRVRVYSWYDAIFHSLGCRNSGLSSMSVRAHYAHSLMQQRLINAANHYRLVVHWWEDLFEDSYVDKHFPCSVASCIKASRQDRGE